MGHMLPTKVFATSGVGRHPDKLIAFERALRDAGVSHANQVCVSSILPPHCKLVSKEEGIQMIPPGAIIFSAHSRLTVMQKTSWITAACGIAIPNDRSLKGYLSEFEANHMQAKTSAVIALDLAAEMCANDHGKKYQMNLEGEEFEKQRAQFSDFMTFDSVAAEAEIVSPNEHVCVFAGYIFCDYRLG